MARKFCEHPTIAWMTDLQVCKDGIKSKALTFSANAAYEYYLSRSGVPFIAKSLLDKAAIELPCGKCAACLCNKREDWATRLCHESSCYGDDVCFLTLTYNDAHLPFTDEQPYLLNGLQNPRKTFDWSSGTPTLCLRDVQLFLKRLRRAIEPRKIRYYLVGEYGTQSRRPHYHMLIFGFKPSDLSFWKIIKGHPVYRSAFIESLWTRAAYNESLGFSTVEDVTPGVVRYCAQYVTKKMIVKSTPDNVMPEFYRQSVRNGGIGSSWLRRWYRSIVGITYVTYRNGRNILKAPIPRYYVHWLRINHPALYLIRRDMILSYLASNVPRRTISDFENSRKSVEKKFYETSCQLRERML